MTRILSFFLGITLAGVAAAADAPPQADIRLQQAQGWIFPRSGGCGLGVRRGPFDNCSAVYGAHHSYYVGYYRGYAPYEGPPNPARCNGGGVSRVCNFYGVCWNACN